MSATKEGDVRKLVAAGFSALVFAAVAPAATASAGPPTNGATSSRVSMTAKITSFHATDGTPQVALRHERVALSRAGEATYLKVEACLTWACGAE